MSVNRIATGMFLSLSCLISADTGRGDRDLGVSAKLRYLPLGPEAPSRVMRTSGAQTVGALGQRETAAFSCISMAGSPPIVRAEGFTELLGDLVLVCSGGTPTAAGQPVPQMDVQIFLNTNITSRLTSDPWSEALLLIDDPGPGVQRYCSQTGGCATTGIGQEAGSDGRSDGVDYDDASGAVPNVYQGQQTGSNSIRWSGVPLDPPGENSVRIVRITNVRANANMLGVSNTLMPTEIQMLISITGTTSVLVSNPQLTLGYILPGMNFAVRQVVGSYLQSVSFNPAAAMNTSSDLLNGFGTVFSFSELFASAFKRRNVALAENWDESPEPMNQNWPGVLYNTETGFYNSTPNVVVGPANGLGIAGLADHGTRLMARFTNVPAGVALYASVYPVRTCLDCGAGGRPAITAVIGSSTVTSTAARLVSTDANGGGLFHLVTSTNSSTFDGGAATAPIPLTNGAGYAVWEVLDADPSSLQTFEFGIGVAYVANTVNNVPGLGTATAAGSFAPLSTAATASALAALPRFFDNNVPRDMFTMTAGTVAFAGATATVPATSGTGSVALTVTPGDGVWVANSNAAWLTVTPASGSGSAILSYSYASNGSVGLRTGTITIGAQAFSVTQSGLVGTVMLTPGSDTAPAAGATGKTVTVTANAADFTWTAIPDVAWLTITAGTPGTGSGAVTYTVAPNPSTVSRVGTITIGGVEFLVNQAGLPTFDISKTTDAVPMGGVAGRTVTVAAIAGLNWTASSTASWITVTGGSSGSGNGTVTYMVQPNSTVMARTGTIAINDLELTITQAGPTPVATGPLAGSGASNLFTFRFTHPEDYSKLDVVNALINQYMDGDRACYIAYSQPLQVLYLVNDGGPGSGLSPGLPLGSGSGSVSNSQCTVNGSGSSATGMGNTLTLTLDIQFAPAFAGSRVVYLAARDQSGGNSGWFTQGAWTVPGAVVTYPLSTGVSPATGTTATTVISYTFDDQTSAYNLKTVWALLNTSIDGRRACYVAYYAPGNRLYLYPDNGDGLQATNIALTGGNTIENSQCKISATGSSVTRSGQRLTLNLNVQFKSAFTGSRGIWTASQTMTDVVGPWTALGNWLVP